MRWSWVTSALSSTTRLEVGPSIHVQAEAYPDDPLESLVEDIETDKQVALKSLSRPAYEKSKSDLIFDTTQSKL